jgi:DnaJ-class molecular chaperone
MTLYSGDEVYGDEVYGDEITSPDCDVLDDAPEPNCWLCDGSGRVVVERDRQGRATTQVCMACRGTGRSDS